jgi:hypothetical protein
MAESLLHKYYVNQILVFINDTITTDDHSFITYADIDLFQGATPELIGGSKPDVLAVNQDRATVIIGEAKTAGDVENTHTMNQLLDYLKYLQKIKNGVLILAVPWHMTGVMDSMVRKAKRMMQNIDLKYIIMLDLPTELPLNAKITSR